MYQSLNAGKGFTTTFTYNDDRNITTHQQQPLITYFHVSSLPAEQRKINKRRFSGSSIYWITTTFSCSPIRSLFKQTKYQSTREWRYVIGEWMLNNKSYSSLLSLFLFLYLEKIPISIPIHTIPISYHMPVMYMCVWWSKKKIIKLCFLYRFIIKNGNRYPFHILIFIRIQIIWRKKYEYRKICGWEKI